MPFTIGLRTSQTTDRWTFKSTAEAVELNNLIIAGKRQQFVERLAELSATGRKFTRTKQVVYEMFDEGEKISVKLKFHVKGPVITWSFVAPMDQTHQSFRDEVFNTAAKAHACVPNSCETYYRGTDWFHVKEMHNYAQESEFNHNHYRAKDGVITPMEVYEHVMAFYAQKEGRRFLPDEQERDAIIIKHAIYWADDAADIRYVFLSFLPDEGGISRVVWQLEEIARIGKPNPIEAKAQLAEFFSSSHGKDMLKIAEKFGLNISLAREMEDEIARRYELAFEKFAPKKVANPAPSAGVVDTDDDVEPFFVSEVSSMGSKGSSVSSRKSPRDEYLSDPSQEKDEIDILEFEAFAADLTKHCQSVRKELLEDLDFKDFRKGLMLYHALRTAQQGQGLTPEMGQRFHPDVLTNEVIRKMIEELPVLQLGSTEDDLGAPLLNKLLTWVKSTSPDLDAWVEWVKFNGSRGLGSELAKVRLADGTIDLNQALPQTDRDRAPGAIKIAEIDFDRVHLPSVFDPHQTARTHGLLEDLELIELKGRAAAELKRAADKQRTHDKEEPNVFQAKVKVISTVLDVLSGKRKIDDLEVVIAVNNLWKTTSIPSMKSSLELLVRDVKEFYSPKPPALAPDSL